MNTGRRLLVKHDEWLARHEKAIDRHEKWRHQYEKEVAESRRDFDLRLKALVKSSAKPSGNSIASSNRCKAGAPTAGT